MEPTTIFNNTSDVSVVHNTTNGVENVHVSADFFLNNAPSSRSSSNESSLTLEPLPTLISSPQVSSSSSSSSPSASSFVSPISNRSSAFPSVSSNSNSPPRTSHVFLDSFSSSSTSPSPIPLPSLSSSSSSSAFPLIAVESVTAPHGVKRSFRTFGGVDEDELEEKSSSQSTAHSNFPLLLPTLAPSPFSSSSSSAQLSSFASARSASREVMEILDDDDEEQSIPPFSSSSLSSSSSSSSSTLNIKSELQSSAISTLKDDGVEVIGSILRGWKKDPDYDYRLDYSVALVARGDGDEWLDLPSVNDREGNKIFIGRPGTSFGVRVSRNSFNSRRPLVRVLIDGRDIGYYHYFGTAELSYIFKGFQSDGAFTAYRSFVFASTIPKDEKPVAVKKEDPDEVRAIGSVVCKFFDYEYQTLSSNMKVQNFPSTPFNPLIPSAPAPLPPSAIDSAFASQQRRAVSVTKGIRDDGVKFWQRPGLSTSSSCTVAIRCQSEQGRGRAVQKELLCAVTQRYDNAEYLELRGLLSREDPHHADYLKAHQPISQERRDAFSSALVKKEKGLNGDYRVKREKHSDDQCDLTADGEEKWTIRKRVKHEHYENLNDNEEENQ